jgi:beta-glucosidase
MTSTALPYRDAALPLEARVADLLARMSLEEKVAQLGSAWSFQLTTGEALDEAKVRDLLRHGIGHISRVAGATNLDEAAAAAMGNAIQRFLVESTRLGIPAILHEESLHGVIARGATVFQQSIGAAASFDPTLVEEMAATLRRRLLLIGARHALAPVLDISRDPRWGRVEETYGEDPYLAVAMGVAYVRAIQGDDLTTGVAATTKHLVGHGLAEGGMNQAPAHVGRRELRDEHMLPFEAAIRDAGAATVMPAYCDVDGLPSHASRELLTTILRDEWGFDGLVVSDYTAVEMLATEHRLTKSVGAAGVMALEAGMDAELPNTAAYGAPLLEAVAAGRVPEAVVDLAVERTLRLKFRLGLFDQTAIAQVDPAVLAQLQEDEHRAARRLAASSLVLVQNDGTLPIAPASSGGPARIAVVGPIADSARDLVGDYTHLLHIEVLNDLRQRKNPFGFPIAEPLVPADEFAAQPTIVDALRQRFAGAEVVHAPGCGIRDGSDADLEAAVQVAAASDVALVVLGERSGLTEDSTTGEFRDRSTLGFLGRQQELLERVVATGTPVVLIVVSGRPLAIEWAARNVAAILVAWVPGVAGPEVIAEVLAGSVNPGGKLPISFPRTIGQIPLSYRHHPTGGHSNPRGSYVDGPTTPLWPFGHGLSYTSFELSNLALSADRIATGDGEVAISVDVANTGDRVGDEVVQLYVRDEEASVARPVIELLGFRRVTLERGQRRRVTFVLHAEQFAYTDVGHRLVVEPGEVTVSIGTSSVSRPLSATLLLEGPTVVVCGRSHYVTRTALA